MSLKLRIQDDMKASMRAREAQRLAALRLLLAAIKQREVDGQCELDDAGITAVLDKQLKQRRDSAKQYADAGRQDLADNEIFEIAVIEAYMPAQMDEAQIDEAVAAAMAELGASTPADIGKVMGRLKGSLAGRADMGQVSARVKQALSR